MRDDGSITNSPRRAFEVLVERRGRFGLPPIFSSVDRIGIVEIEAASAVQVRLFSGPVATAPGHDAGATTRGSEPTNRRGRAHHVNARVVLAPTGQPFPVSADRLKNQHQQRSVRRWAGGLIFLDGLLNVIVTHGATAA